MFDVGWVGAMTAVCALALGVYNTIVQQGRDRVRVRIDLSWGVSTGEMGPQIVLLLNFVNLGQPEVRFTSCGLSLPGNKNMVYLRPINLPKTVKSQNSAMEPESASYVRVSLQRHGFSGRVKVRGYVYDATGKRYLSKSLVVDTDSSDD